MERITLMMICGSVSDRSFSAISKRTRLTSRSVPWASVMMSSPLSVSRVSSSRSFGITKMTL